MAFFGTSSSEESHECHNRAKLFMKLHWTFSQYVLLTTQVRSLAPADFSGAIFTYTHFQRIAQISKNSFTHVFFITIDLSAADLAPADFCHT